MPSVLNKAGLRLRSMHKVHPKARVMDVMIYERLHFRYLLLQRYGVRVEFPDKKLPEVTKEEFYNVCMSASSLITNFRLPISYCQSH